LLAGVIFYRFFRVLVKNENGNRTTNMEVITVPTLFVIYRFGPKIPNDIIIQFFFLIPEDIIIQFFFYIHTPAYLYNLNLTVYMCM